MTIFHLFSSWLTAPATAQVARFWLQNGLILWLQTAILLLPGVWALRWLGRRKSTARSFVGRSLLVSAAGVMLCGSLSSGHFAALWQVSLPVAPVVRAEVPSSETVESPAFAPPKIASPRAQSEASQPPLAAMNRESRSIETVEAAPAAPIEQPAATSPRIVMWAAAIWLGGALILAVWWLGCHLFLWRMRRGAKAVEDLETRAILAEVCASWRVSEPQLLTDSRVSSPFLSGMFRPAILLPKNGPALTSESLRAVLGHEITHLKRRDLWWSALGRALCAVLWPQPLLWILCRQLEQINEEACDRATLEAGCERHQLANCLLDWAQRGVPTRAQRIAGAGVWTKRSSLSRRVQAILSEPLGKRRLSIRARWVIAGAVLLGAASTPLLISGRAAPSGSFHITDLPLPDPQLNIIDRFAVGMSRAENGLLHDVKLQVLVQNRVLVSYEAPTVRRSPKSPNLWIFDKTLTRLYAPGGNRAGKRESGVMIQLSPSVTRYLLAQFPTPKSPKSLQESFNDANSHVEIGGVSKGELQGVSIRYSPNKKGLMMIVARSARRQKVGSSGETRWVLRDGQIDTFNDKGLQSESRFDLMTLSPSSLPAAAILKFLDQQSRAASQPLPPSQWTEIKQSSALPRVQLATLKSWAKGQGHSAISGRVVDEAGQPVAGAKVVVRMADDVFRRVSKTSPNDFPIVMMNLFAVPKTAREIIQQSATTGSDGTYLFRGLANVTYHLNIPAYGRNARFHSEIAPPPQVLLKEQQVTATAKGETKAPDLNLTRGGLIRVRVEDKDSGAPLPDVTIFGSVKAPASAQRLSYWVDSDANGQSLFRLPAGTASIAIGGHNRAGSHALVTEVNGVFYGLTKGAEVALDGGAARPFPDRTEVQIIRSKTRQMTIRLTRYVAPPVPTPTPAPRLVPPPAGRATLTGRVVDKNGRPLRGVVVRALIQQAARWKLMSGAGLALSNSKTPNWQQKRDSVEGVFFERAETGADGSFRLNGLTTAPYNLIVGSALGNSGDASTVAAAVEGIWAKEGQSTVRAAPIVLTSGGWIEGRVVDSVTGAGLGGIILGSNGPQLPSSSDNSAATHCDAQGRFKLRVAPGTTSIYIMGPAEDGDNFVFADTKKPAEAVYLIRSSRGVYAGSNNVQFEVDGGPSQRGLNWKNGPFERIEIAVKKGQTRTLTLHLRRLSQGKS